MTSADVKASNSAQQNRANCAFITKYDYYKTQLDLSQK